METKKNQSANIENLRTPITLVGLLFTGSIVLASFTYKSGMDRDTIENYTASETHIVLDAQEINNTPPPPAPPVASITPPVTEAVVELENTETEPIIITQATPPQPPIVTTQVEVTEDVIEWPEQEAKFDGDMQQWIAENVQYPQTSIDLNEQGKVYLTFVVKKDGSITNILIERSVSPDIDREAKRLLRAMPKWIPGESKGQKVNTRCYMPINFTLE